MRVSVEQLIASFSVRRGGAKGFAIAFLLMAFALALRFVIAPVEGGLQYVTFFPAVTLSVVIAGFWPGIFATAMGALFATIFFTFPYYSLSLASVSNSLWSNTIFMMDGLVVCSAVEAMYRYRLRYAQELRESQEAHAELQRSSHLYKQVFDNVLDGIITIDDKGVVTSFNRGAEQMFGYAAEDVIGHNVLMLMPSPDHERHNDYLRNYAQGAERQIIGIGREVTGRRKDGSTFPMDLAVTEVETGERMYTGIMRDISVRKQAEEEMERLAHYDTLTGLPNRVLFGDRIQRCIVAARRNNTQFALVYLDLNQFKPVNDTYGHDVGDALLRETANRLGACVRESDTICRIGGDEFVILLPPASSTHDVAVVGEKIRQAFIPPFELDGARLDISTSAGAAIFPEHGESEAALIRNADAAMYHAKKHGHSGVLLYGEGMIMAGTAQEPGVGESRG